jgi:DNA-binding NtrC family response regulator
METVRVEDLNVSELLELAPDGGPARFAGHRTLLVDPLSVGLLTKHLVGSIGQTAARALMTRVGFSQGWELAERVESELPWDREEDRLAAGTRLLAMAGLFRPVPGGGVLASDGIVVESSYEAEQHLQHLGNSEAPACWATCGLLSGYLSRVQGRRIFVLESRCLARGDAACHLHGRAEEEWGTEHADALRFFEATRLEETLDASLQHVAESLKAAETRIRRHKRAAAREAPEGAEPLWIVVRSEAMRAVVELARRVAKVDSTVLITGESGTGKERFARFIHEASSRAAGPMVAVNCGAITETLLEAELFGHVRGAFTGATQDRAGLFEAAAGGTLLLDEVGEVSAAMQVKLLRALQEREIRRVGETRSRPIDVRIVAATNRDLVREVASGAFRQDLYYRLRVVELAIPPLRERREDVLPLARTLLQGAAARMASKVTTLSPAAADRLLRYGWPGNVRELENAMERAIALARGGRVELEDLPEEVRRAAFAPAGAPSGSARPLEEIEREHILAVLAKNDGNQTRTAEQLQIGTATLYRKLKRYAAAAKLRPKRGA